MLCRAWRIGVVSRLINLLRSIRCQQVIHGATAVFDDPNLVSSARPGPVFGVAACAGLHLVESVEASRSVTRDSCSLLALGERVGGGRLGE